jgi:two-component system, chemotaxis family, chemotaxis protein CheY
MNNPTDVTILVCSSNASIARTLRMALRGIGVRAVHLAADSQQISDGFLSAEPTCLAVYVDGPEKDDGLEMIRFIRRSATSPNQRIPIIAVSPRRDLATVNAVINAGGHEYVVFPSSGETLLKKVTAARQTSRPFIEQPDYVGPCRRRRSDPAYAGPERRAFSVARAAS